MSKYRGMFQPDYGTPATWVNGKKRIEGYYFYYWPRDTWIVTLKSRDRVTGELRRLDLLGYDAPEWGNWKLVREEKEATP